MFAVLTLSLNSDKRIRKGICIWKIKTVKILLTASFNRLLVAVSILMVLTGKAIIKQHIAHS